MTKGASISDSMLEQAQSAGEEEMRAEQERQHGRPPQIAVQPGDEVVDRLRKGARPDVSSLGKGPLFSSDGQVGASACCRAARQGAP